MACLHQGAEALGGRCRHLLAAAPSSARAATTLRPTNGASPPTLPPDLHCTACLPLYSVLCLCTLPLYSALCCRCWCRYVSNLGQVPSLAPFDVFRQVPHGMWLRDNLVLLQVRGRYC